MTWQQIEAACDHYATYLERALLRSLNRIVVSIFYYKINNEYNAVIKNKWVKIIKTFRPDSMFNKMMHSSNWICFVLCIHEKDLVTSLFVFIITCRFQYKCSFHSDSKLCQKSRFIPLSESLSPHPFITDISFSHISIFLCSSIHQSCLKWSKSVFFQILTRQIKYRS